jgi:type II secretory pathway component PulK
MKNNKKNNRSKGSVLIAVIGILAVMSVMALRFNVEMETAMIKTAGKNLASDVRVLADSGLRYVIAQILKNGLSCNGTGGHQRQRFASPDALTCWTRSDIDGVF